MSLAAGDIDAYCARIGWDGPLAPDRATLDRLVACHSAAIPFENLDAFVGRPIELAPERLVAKLVHGGRGGYCFEQNGLFALVLEAIGFRVVRLAARVLWGHPDDAVTMRTHQLLLVELEAGPAIVDVGFGGGTPTAPLDLVDAVEQPTPHEPFRLLRRGGEWGDAWIQQVLQDGSWRSTYRFELHPQHPIDFEVPNWWASTSPRFHLTQLPVAARPFAGGRYGLRGRDFTIRGLDGSVERHRLDDAALVQVLEQHFALAPPPELSERLSIPA